MAGRSPRDRATSHPVAGNSVKLLRATMAAAADLLLPLCCAVCDRLMRPSGLDVICGPCWSRVRGLAPPRCDRCGHPMGSHTCRWCALLPPYVRAARSFCWVGAGTGGDVVHAFKYDGWKRAGRAMAERMARVSWPRDVEEERTATLPVPLSASRLRERGFNQSEILAAEVAQLWGIPAWTGTLERARSTRSQTELTPGERRANVAGAFCVQQAEVKTLRGAHVVLVDDVVTTCATLNACASALFNAGARTISYLTFGRAPASGDRLFS